MAVDTRELIAEAVVTLLTEKKVRKLTVKDIVEECNITRQTFYYHFADIPDLIRWVLDRHAEEFIQNQALQGDAEGALRYLLALFIQSRPILQQGMKTNYADDLQRILKQHLLTLSETIADHEGLYLQYSSADRRIIIHYHCMAMMGCLQDWTEADTRNLDHLVHLFVQLMRGEISQ